MECRVNMRKQIKDEQERIEKEKTEVGQEEKSRWQTEMCEEVGVWFSASCCGL